MHASLLDATEWTSEFPLVLLPCAYLQVPVWIFAFVAATRVKVSRLQATFTLTNFRLSEGRSKKKIQMWLERFFFFINPRMEDTWRVTFEILQWHSCVMLHDKHMDRCHAEGLLCLNKGINDACFLTSTLPTGTLRSVSIHLISSIFLSYYSDSP